MSFNSQTTHEILSSSFPSSDRERLYDSIDIAREKSKEKDDNDKKAGWFLAINFWIVLTIWLCFIIIGGSFYNYEDEYGWNKGLYYAVNVGFNIGWNWDDTESDDSITFSIFYLLVGAFLLSLLLVYVGENSLERRHKCFVSYVEEREYHEEVVQGKLAPLSISDKIANWYQNNFMVITFSSLYIVWVFVGVIWSCNVVGWSFLDGLYFALSSLSAGGMYSLPDDSPDWFYGFTAFYAAIGIPIMALAFGFIASVIILPFTYFDQFNLMHLKITNKEVLALSELGLSIKHKEQEVSQLQRTRSNSQDKADSTIQLDQATYFLLMMVRMKIVDSSFVTYILKKHREYAEEEKSSRKNSTASSTAAITRGNTLDNTNSYQNSD